MKNSIRLLLITVGLILQVFYFPASVYCLFQTTLPRFATVNAEITTRNANLRDVPANMLISGAHHSLDAKQFVKIRKGKILDTFLNRCPDTVSIGFMKPFHNI